MFAFLLKIYIQKQASKEKKGKYRREKREKKRERERKKKLVLAHSFRWIFLFFTSFMTPFDYYHYFFLSVCLSETIYNIEEYLSDSKLKLRSQTAARERERVGSFTSIT